MIYVENLAEWLKDSSLSKTQQVLKDLDLRMAVMSLINTKLAFHQHHPLPLMKFWIESDEIKLVFDPKSYIHLVNISRSINQQAKQQDISDKS